MKKMHVISACLSTLLVFAAGCQSLNESADISRGGREIKRSRYEQAITDFTLALQKNPQSADAYFGLAVAWEAIGEYDRAKRYYSKAVELDPRFAFFYDVGSTKPESADIRRAWRERAKSYDKAIASFNLAIQKNPRSAEAFIGLADIYENKRNYNKAIEYLSKAIEIEPNSGYFWLRGEVWQSKEPWSGKKKNSDFEQAIEDYTGAINKDPHFAPAYTDRGSCYMSIGEYQVALADYQKALQLVSTNSTPYGRRVQEIASAAISDLQKKLRKT